MFYYTVGRPSVALLLIVNMLLVIKPLLLRIAGKLLLRLLFLVGLLRRALCIALREARNGRRTYGALRLRVSHYKNLGNVKVCYGGSELEDL